MLAEDPRTFAATYFQAWKAKDFATLRSLLADDATFRGPLGSADDADTCIQGLKGMAQILLIPLWFAISWVTVRCWGRG